MKIRDKKNRLELIIKDNPKLSDRILYASIIFGFFYFSTMMFISFDIFFSGFHNIDLAYNWNYLEQHYGINLEEHGSNGEYWTEPNELYNFGVNQIMKGSKYLAIYGLLFGMFMMTVFNITYQGIKKDDM